jgi:hypothetical protein
MFECESRVRKYLRKKLYHQQLSDECGSAASIAAEISRFAIVKSGGPDFIRHEVPERQVVIQAFSARGVPAR